MRRSELLENHAAERLVPRMAVEDDEVPEPVSEHRLGDVDHAGLQGRVSQAERAGIVQMVCRSAHGELRQDQDIGPDPPIKLAKETLADHRIGGEGEMRAVLFDGRDGQEDRRRPGDLTEFQACHLIPFHDRPPCVGIDRSGAASRRSGLAFASSTTTGPS